MSDNRMFYRNSHLIKQNFIKVPHEELRIALLCTRYLSFGCFKNDLTDHRIQAYIMDGHYSFLDYAAVHWLDHLEACGGLFEACSTGDIDNLDLEGNPANLARYLEVFVDRHWKGGAKEPAVSGAVKRRFGAFAQSRASGRITQLASIKGSGLGKEGFLKLGPFINRMRDILEQAALAGNGESLSPFYGDQLFKCELPYCVHFHDGFTSAESRRQHLDGHLRPFKCPHAGCPTATIGCPSKRQLNAHLAKIHPNPKDDDVQFPPATAIPENITGDKPIQGFQPLNGSSPSLPQLSE